MKRIATYFSILSLMQPNIVFAQKAKSENIVQIENKADPEEKMKTLIDSDPNLKTMYNSCKKNESSLDKIPNCLWESVQSNQQLKDKVLKFFEADKKNQKPEDKIMVKDNSVKIDQSNDPYLKKLDEIIAKKFDEIFKTKGAGTKDQIARSTYLQTDHKKFAELYNTHLSSTITQAISSYCLDANSSFEIDEKTAESNRNKNLAALKNSDFETKVDCSKITEQNKSACHFNQCVPKISDHCYNRKEDDYTKKRACSVMDYIKNARSGILTIEKQLEAYKKLSNQNGIQLELKGMKAFENEGDIKRDAQDITTITSAEILEANEEAKKELDALDCTDGTTIKNIETCKKLISKDKEKAEVALAEFGMRRIAQVEKIKEDLSGKSDQEIIEFLQSEGDSKEDAEKYVQALRSEKKDPIEEILKKYRAENDAIIKSYKDKFEKNLISEAEINTSAQKLQQIQKELQYKGESYAKMLHYSNIVSSFLTIGSGKEGKKNTAVITRELASAKKLNSKDTASQNLLENLDAIQKNFKNDGSSNANSKSEQTTLSVKDINDIILNKDDGKLDKVEKP